MMTRLLTGSLLVVIIVGLLGASLSPEFVSAQGEPPRRRPRKPSPAACQLDGLFDAPRLPSADGHAQDVPQALAGAGIRELEQTRLPVGPQSTATGRSTAHPAMAPTRSTSPITALRTSTRRLNRGATRVVFASKRPGNYDLYVMNADGSGQTRLTTSSADDVDPAWSPDGSRIVFQAYRNGQAEIYVMNADGSGQTRLTNHSDYDGQPAWSPDGTQIAFVRRVQRRNTASG